MAAKTCKHCRNFVPEEEFDIHTLNCAMNPDVQEKTRKLGEIESFVKTVVLEGTAIVRMYWAHSTGAQDIEIEPVLNAWKQINPKVDPNNVKFLQSRGFKVINA